METSVVCESSLVDVVSLASDDGVSSDPCVVEVVEGVVGVVGAREGERGWGGVGAGGELGVQPLPISPFRLTRRCRYLGCAAVLKHNLSSQALECLFARGKLVLRPEREIRS